MVEVGTVGSGMVGAVTGVSPAVRATPVEPEGLPFPLFPLFPLSLLFGFSSFIRLPFFLKVISPSR
ncbi:hypothetical protein [Nitratidesulfovibrio sp.]|uniref:hypothetical protein n=1 Tax=Nitratidesulfovibrio sp. TaxID=2802297 RepID=UPI00333F5B15